MNEWEDDEEEVQTRWKIPRTQVSSEVDQWNSGRTEEDGPRVKIVKQVCVGRRSESDSAAAMACSVLLRDFSRGGELTKRRDRDQPTDRPTEGGEEAKKAAA